MVLESVVKLVNQVRFEEVDVFEVGLIYNVVVLQQRVQLHGERVRFPKSGGAIV